MNLTELTKLAGAHQRRKRVGRGESSGHGKTSGRGHKGCNARAGGGAPWLREGGQMPIIRRIPKRGFSNAAFRTVYSLVNTGQLQDAFDDGTEVSPDALQQVGLIRRADERVKILGDGTLTKKLVVHAHKFSDSAVAKITAAGGEVRRI
jgi:large subunit ribosomal protein L15